MRVRGGEANEKLSEIIVVCQFRLSIGTKRGADTVRYGEISYNEKFYDRGDICLSF